MGTESAGSIQTSTALFYVLDAVVLLILFAVKVPLFAVCLTLISRRTAVTRLRHAVEMVALLSVAYFLFNTTPEAVLSLRAYLLMALIGTLLCTRRFRVDLEKSFVGCLLFCCLGILMDSYAQRGMDRLLAGRTTIARAMAHAVDTRVRRVAGDDSLPPSTGVVPAVLRLTATPAVEDAIAQPRPARLAPPPPIRAAHTSAPPSRVEADTHPPAGGAAVTNAAAKEPAATPRQPLEGLARTGAAETVSAPAAPQHASAVTSAAHVTSSAGVPVTPPPTPTRPPVPAATSAARQAASPGSIAAVAPRPPAAAPVKRSAWDRLSSAERRNWEIARRQIRVSSVGWSATDAYVMVDRHMLNVGSTHAVIYRGNEYVFRFRGVTRDGTCKWDPVLSSDEPEGTAIAF